MTSMQSPFDVARSAGRREIGEFVVGRIEVEMINRQPVAVGGIGLRPIDKTPAPMTRVLPRSDGSVEHVAMLAASATVLAPQVWMDFGRDDVAVGIEAVLRRPLMAREVAIPELTHRVYRAPSSPLVPRLPTVGNRAEVSRWSSERTGERIAVAPPPGVVALAVAPSEHRSFASVDGANGHSYIVAGCNERGKTR